MAATSQPDAQGGAAEPPCTELGEKAGDHRRPRFQSSSRA